MASISAAQGRTSTAQGQAVYNPLVLALYDWFVVGFTCTSIWKCSATRLLGHYARNVGDRHLDCGVGTGYYLDRATFPYAPRITLFDLNENALRHAAQRIQRYTPDAVLGDVLEPGDIPPGQYDSIGVNFLFHCLPDGGAGKWRALDHLKDRLAPGGVLFGSTVLGARPPLLRQRLLMGIYNRLGIFSNRHDDLATLRRELEARFDHVEVKQHGVVAMFLARYPREDV